VSGRALYRRVAGLSRRAWSPDPSRELDGHHCLGYAYRARQDTWRFSNAAGDEETVTPTGPLRVTNVDALIPTVLDGIAIAELPEFIASDYLADGRLEAS
jgi:DNA-binding transcriptional LysR family regulator